MRSALQKAFLFASPVLLATAALAVPAGDLKEHYQPIIERNPFGLRPPVVAPPPVTKPPEAPKPKVEIFLTGITTIGYPRVPKHVYLMTREQGNKEPSYLALPEQAEQNGIKILEVNEILQTVKIATDEGEMMLSFKDNGITNATPAAVAGAPGAIPTPPGTIPPPLNQAGRPGRPSYNRDGRNDNNNAAVNNLSQNLPSSSRTIPSRQVRVRQRGEVSQPGQFDAGGGQAGQDAPQAPPDPAMQYLQMRAQEQYNKSQGIPTPPVPPIPGM